MKLTAKKREQFLQYLRDESTVLEACAKIVISNFTIYKHRRKDEDFRRDWDEAIEEADAKKLATMEQEADRRAVEGNLRPVYYKGQVAGAVREYSDNLLMFRMKSLAPNKYRDNATVEIELGKRSLADLFNAEDR